MKATPKTIQIFLPGGDPQGIRIAEITTRIVQVIEVPRSLLSEFSKLPESNQVAFYFLFGEDDDEALKVYIGQTGDLHKRLAKHSKEKDFWERALVVVSRTNSLTQTHALFLEWFCLQACREAGRYSDENGNSGSKPHTPPPLEADCLEIFDTSKTLLSTLGYPVFDPVAKPIAPNADDELFHCIGSGANGRGQLTSEGFVVLRESSGRLEHAPSTDEKTVQVRQQLIASDVLKVKGDQIVFQKDHLFRSPSRAAAVLMGRTANGWIEWKDVNGTTLNELKRQSND